MERRDFLRGSEDSDDEVDWRKLAKQMESSDW